MKRNIFTKENPRKVYQDWFQSGCQVISADVAFDRDQGAWCTLCGEVLMIEGRALKANYWLCPCKVRSFKEVKEKASQFMVDRK